MVIDIFNVLFSIFDEPGSQSSSDVENIFKRKTLLRSSPVEIYRTFPQVSMEYL